MSSLSIQNYIRVSLLAALLGLASKNTSALALFTDEVPISTSYGTFGVYLDPVGVGQDFGTNSETFRISNSVFNQTPNIKTGGGFLIIIPQNQTAPASAATIISDSYVNLTLLTASDYNINLDVDAAGAADLLIGTIDTTTLATAEASLNSVAVSGAGATFSLSGEVTACRVTLVSDTPGATSALDVAAAGTGTDIAPGLQIDLKSATGAATGVERVIDAILRTYTGVDYFGIISNVKQTDANLTEIASLVQSLDKIFFVGSNLSADIAGIFTTLQAAGYTHTRCMYYSITENDAIDLAAGYASRGLSINFSGSKTSLTMHAKRIIGLVGDTGLTQTILDNAKAAGVEIYGDFGVPKLFTSGVNQFFDKVYTDLAFKLFLSVAGFNALGQTPTEIPQTEAGLNSLKKAFRDVCDQFITNGVHAPGVWNDPTTFGNPEDHIRNIAEHGYFVYSLPIAKQTQQDRTLRIAPLVQIAAKSSGAFHSSNVVAFIEA